MKIKLFICSFLLNLIILSLHAQKAYDNISYYGNTGKYSIVLKYAHGYYEASEIKVSNSSTNLKFTAVVDHDWPDSSANLKLIRTTVKGVKFNDYFILNNMNGERIELPSKVYGSYFSKGIKLPFMLTRVK